jgi:hypothetical protein
MIKDVTEGKLLEAILFSNRIKNYTLIDCLESLKQWVDNNKDNNSEVYVYNDRAKHSFYFVKKLKGEFSGNGGIIYHGKHEDGTNTPSNTFNITIDNSKGWQIHT